MDVLYKDFYENIDRENTYTKATSPEEHRAYNSIISFVKKYGLTGRKVLEIGSSKGLFQDIVADYTGIDVAQSLRRYYRKPFFTVNPDGTYPFEDESFDGVWTWAVFEHIPDVNLALSELARVTRKGGHVFFCPAWQCRSWAAQGYPVRPYSDFNWWGKIVKVSIPVRNSISWRALRIFPKRLVQQALFILGMRPKQLRHKKLMPNYEKFWMSDSDAVNSIDPHDAILWFVSNGFKCLNYPTNLSAFLVKTGPLIFKKCK